jgi:hypothetical protein
MISENLFAAVLGRKCIFGINRKLFTSLMMIRWMVLEADSLSKGCIKIQRYLQTCKSLHVELKKKIYLGNLNLHIGVKIMETL